MMNLKIEAPWQTYGKELKALFAMDKEIDVSEVYEAENADFDFVVDVSVLNHEKFVALDRALVKRVTFGNVTLHVNLFDMENESVDVDIFKTIFDGNPIVQDIVTKRDVTGTDWHYICFKPEVVQFFDDDMSDVNGNRTELAEDIARDVFADHLGVYFCTAAKE